MRLGAARRDWLQQRRTEYRTVNYPHFSVSLIFKLRRKYIYGGSKNNHNVTKLEIIPVFWRCLEREAAERRHSDGLGRQIGAERRVVAERSDGRCIAYPCTTNLSSATVNDNAAQCCRLAPISDEATIIGRKNERNGINAVVTCEIK